MIRTFVAVDIPEDIRKGLDDVFLHLDSIKKIKAVSPSNVHVTLKFLGDVQTSRISAIIKRLEGVESSPFSCSVHQIGVFPFSSRPRVIWLGLDGPFSYLHLQVENALEGLGFEKDKREYTSHATIGRVKSLNGGDKEHLETFLQEYGDKFFGEFEVSSFQLKKSTLTPKGPIYETLYEVSL